MDNPNNNAILRGGAAAEMTLDELFGAVEQEWQDQALCAQTDPEAFFPEKGVRPAKLSAFARLVPSAMSAWNMHLNMMKDLVFGVDSQTVSVAALSARLANCVQLSARERLVPVP